MVQAANASRTPERRSEIASKAAAARWKDNGITRDQERVLRKLVSKREAILSFDSDRPGGRRTEHAAWALVEAEVIAATECLGGLAIARGPKWRPNLVK